VATVSDSASSKGLAIGVAVGTVNLSASFGGRSGSTAVTVTAATLSSIDVEPVDPTIAAGTSVQLSATGLFSDGGRQDLTSQVAWSSSGAAVTVTSAGLARGASPGAATVTATLGGVSDSVALTVTAATLTSLDVQPVDPTIPVLTSLPFTAVGSFSDGSVQDLSDQVVWSSSDPTVATVSNDDSSAGQVQAVGVGTATISATFGAASDTSLLTVVPAALQSIALTPANPTLPLGMSQQLTAIGSYDNGATVDLTAQATWTSASPAFVAVSNASGSQGLATALAAGPSVVTASFEGVDGQTTVTASAATLTSITVASSTGKVPQKYTTRFTATGNYSDGTTRDLTSAVSWTTSNTALATISNVSPTWGVVTGMGPGAVTITARLSGRSGSAALTVTNAKLKSVAITPAASTLPVGQTGQLTATGTFDDGEVLEVTGQVKWTSSDRSIARVSNGGATRGLVTGKAAGRATITAGKGNTKGTAAVTVQ
jgi:hypothetical protein